MFKDHTVSRLHRPTLPRLPTLWLVLVLGPYLEKVSNLSFSIKILFTVVIVYYKKYFLTIVSLYIESN